MSKIQLNGIPCAVCGSEGARNNYRVMTCEKCRVFFFRMVTHRHSPLPICSKNCKYQPGARKNCITCRLKRCLEAGMQPIEVGKWSSKTRYCVDNLSKEDYIAPMQLYHGSLLNYGTMVKEHLKLSCSALEFTHILANFEKISISGTGATVVKTHTNLNMSVKELIQNPGACSNRDTAVFYPVWIDPFVKSVDFNKCYCRSLTAFSEFVNAIEEFHSLDNGDQIQLFQTNVLKYIMLEILYRNYISKKNHYLVYTTLPYSGKNAPPNHWNRRRDLFKRNSIIAIQELLDLDISFEEYLLLRNISLFSNGTNFSAKGQKILIQAREKYTIMLAELAGLFHPSGTVIPRVARIVNIVKYVEEFAVIAHESYVRMVLHNNEDMTGKLSHELHIEGTIYDRAKVDCL